MVNRAEGVPANEERGLVCDVNMGQSQARRAEGDCKYEVVEREALHVLHLIYLFFRIHNKRLV